MATGVAVRRVCGTGRLAVSGKRASCAFDRTNHVRGTRCYFTNANLLLCTVLFALDTLLRAPALCSLSTTARLPRSLCAQSLTCCPPSQTMLFRGIPKSNINV